MFSKNLKDYLFKKQKIYIRNNCSKFLAELIFIRMIEYLINKQLIVH